MASKGTLTVRLIGDSKPLEKTLKGTGKRLGGFVKAVGAASAAAGAVVVAKGVQAAREAQKINRITANVIKTTGGAANVTAKQVDDLSGRLQKLSGVSDETIQRGSNMLLTFTNIRNEVGKNNDIFDQATGIALDLSVAMGTDVKDSAIQVGKALNDPIKGVTALSRVGIQFTDQQREQIKVLVESGDTLGAQKIILKELETQFGGTAEAAADPMQKLMSTLGDVSETIGTAFLPAVDSAATWLSEHLPAAVDRAKEWVQENLVPALQAVKDWWDDNGPAIMTAAQETWDAVTSAVQTFAERLQEFWDDTVKPVLNEIQTAWEENKDTIIAIIGDLREVVEALGRIIGEVFSTAEQDVQEGTDGISENIGTTVDVVEKLTNAVARVVEVFETFTPALLAGADGVRDSIGPIDLITQSFDAWEQATRGVRDALGGMFSGLWESFSGILNRIINAWNDFELTIPSVTIPGVGTIGGGTLSTPDIPNVPEAFGGGTSTGPRPRTGPFHSGGVARFSGRQGLALLADKERVLSPQQTASFDRLVQQLERGAGAGGVTINMPPGSDGDDVVRALRRWTSRNGPVPVATSG